MAPKYLTGDATAINEFLDKFDVRYLLPPPPVALIHHAET